MTNKSSITYVIIGVLVGISLYHFITLRIDIFQWSVIDRLVYISILEIFGALGYVIGQVFSTE